MISIVICSRNKAALQVVSANVGETIGVPYEIIAIDNSKGLYNIFQAYNIGIERSTFPMLCFMHEDISFETPNWGEKVVEIFNANPKLGLLGVAGGSYKSLIPSGWAFHSVRKVTSVHMNINQMYKEDALKKHIYYNPSEESISKVVSVDGVWFCTPKAIAQRIKFDDRVFSNFHCYDVDYSLAVFQEYDVAVTYKVLITHFSEGSFNEAWLLETFKLHEKWKKQLPMSVGSLSAHEQRQMEFQAFQAILPKMAGKSKLSFMCMKALFSKKMLQIVGLKTFSVMNLLLLKKAAQ